MADGTIWEGHTPSGRLDPFGAWTDVDDSYKNLDGGGMTINMAIDLLSSEGKPMRAKGRFGYGSLFGPGHGTGSWVEYGVIGGLGTSAAKKVVEVGVNSIPEHRGELTDWWRDRIAHIAFHQENEDYGRKGGKQDEYAAAFGGILCLYFHPDGKVTVERLQPPSEFVEYLEKHLVVFDTDESRLSSRIHEEVWGNLGHSLSIMEDMIEIAKVGKQAMLRGSILTFADCLRQTCDHQFKLNSTIGSKRIVESIDALYFEQTIMAAKACGAGGGGALVALAKEGEAGSVKAILKGLGYGRVLDWQFNFEGLKVWEMNHPRMTG